MANEQDLPSGEEQESFDGDLVVETALAAGNKQVPEGVNSFQAKAVAQPVRADAQAGSAVQDYAAKVGRILDINVPVTVSFGSVRKPLADILQYSSGSLINLERPAEEPVILKVNGKVFARGEVVEVDGHYGVRISEIISPADRIVSLGETS